ncbi:MAG: guanylate kinase [Clostridiales bacterium]|nr:guanylate kinase [Clostridiales bacterium]
MQETGRLYIVMGKSASGKDTIFQKLKERKELDLETVVPYTTRPIRVSEKEGETYHFVNLEQYEKMKEKGLIVEARTYHTVHGDWIYFTADDGTILKEPKNYIMIGTLETYEKICEYFGKSRVEPIYIEVEDGERLLRAVLRERMQKEPKYKELCRRFIADQEDFSEEKLLHAGIRHRFVNYDLDQCLGEIIQHCFPQMV